MISLLSKQERLILTVVVLVMLIGATVGAALKKFPFLIDIINVMESDAVYRKVDINTASAVELETVPYIGAYTAQQIVIYRQEHGRFQTVESIKEVKGIRDKNYERFYRYLMVAR